MTTDRRDGYRVSFHRDDRFLLGPWDGSIAFVPGGIQVLCKRCAIDELVFAEEFDILMVDWSTHGVPKSGVSFFNRVTDTSKPWFFEVRYGEWDEISSAFAAAGWFPALSWWTTWTEHLSEHQASRRKQHGSET